MANLSDFVYTQVEIANVNIAIDRSQYAADAANAAFDAVNPAFNQANLAYAKANSALANTSDISFDGNLYFPTGNVGIGTTAASYKLDVSGAINASSILVNGAPLSLSIASDTVNATRYIMFANGSSGSIATLNVATGLTFNPSTGALAVPGALSSSSSVGGTTGNFSTSVTSPVHNITADTNNRFVQGGLILRSGSPTIYFRDTDSNSAMLHNNSNLLYVLRGGNDTESWTAVNGQWPWVWNLTNNDSTCGGNLYVVGDIAAFTSDSRLKTDIKNIENALEKVQQIRGIHYRHNELALSYGLDNCDHVGVVAEEIEKVLPEVIKNAPFDIDTKTGKSKSGNNYKTVKYDKIVPLLIEAIKELSNQVDQLKKELTEIKK